MPLLARDVTDRKRTSHDELNSPSMLKIRESFMGSFHCMTDPDQKRPSRRPPRCLPLGCGVAPHHVVSILGGTVGLSFSVGQNEATPPINHPLNAVLCGEVFSSRFLRLVQAIPAKCIIFAHLENNLGHYCICSVPPSGAGPSTPMTLDLLTHLLAQLVAWN